MSQRPTYTAPEWSALPTEKFELEVLKEGSIVATIPLEGKPYFTLGRQHDAVDIPMDHLSISRMHAVLNFRDDGALMLRDLGSAQGTMLNKKTCEKDTYYRVYVGDLLKFGASTRQYIVNGPEEQRKPEYDSVNMEIYRDKLATRSAEIKKKLEMEEEKTVFSWGMREDAEEPEDRTEQDEEELPDYLRKMKKDENFDRKYGDKFTANISETEAKNSKDAEIMEKIRKKERKIQNMQEENRRIYLKEGAQEDGLTAGQSAAVARNDKSIASLTDEIAQLVGQIRAKAADRGGAGAAGEGASSGNKRSSRENDDEDDVLDLSGQTADASTNWRLRKKLQKNVHLTAGAAGAAGTSSGVGVDGGESKALSYSDIKQQLVEQNELNARLLAQLESTQQFISSQEVIIADGRSTSVLQGDQIESVVAEDRIADSKATLKRLQNEQSSVAMRLSRLEKLLQIATPALPSLVSQKGPSLVAEKGNPAKNVLSDPIDGLSKPHINPLPTALHAPKGPSALMGPPNLGVSAPSSVVDSDLKGNVEATEEDKLNSLVRFIEQEKAAEEAELKRKDLEAKAKAASMKAAEDVQASAPTSSSSHASSGASTGSARRISAPAPMPQNQHVHVKGPVRGSAPRPSDETARFDSAVLEGGEAAWVPPPKQTGDGKTSLNAKHQRNGQHHFFGPLPSKPDSYIQYLRMKLSQQQASPLRRQSGSSVSTPNNTPHAGGLSAHGSFIAHANGTPLGALRGSSPRRIGRSLNSSFSMPLPSLSTELPPSAKLMSTSEFVTSVPIFRRERFDLFGLNGDEEKLITKMEAERSVKSFKTKAQGEGMSVGAASHRLARIRTLSTLRIEKMEEEKESLFAVKTKGKKANNVGYNINKLLGGNDPFMKSEDERKEKLDIAVQKKKDRADDLFNKKKKVRSMSMFARPITPHDEQEQLDKAAAELAKAESAEKGSDELAGRENEFFGEKARSDLALKFKKASKDLERYPNEEDLPAEKKTPRQLYLREVAKSKLMPLPIILRKDSNPMGIHLSHRGLGDARVAPLIKVMHTLPAIQTIDLCDNRLTDVTLVPLAANLIHFKSLTHLDLSFNKMDDSSAAIMDFLRSDDCKLFTLLLNGADVDDGECRNLAEAISHNQSIKTLGLSKNLIGSDELLNVLNPSLITGGEALGDMLRKNTTLTELDLSWNAIRLESAIAIAEALEQNSTLKTLYLGYNSFGDMPSQVLGRTLKTNTGLTLLDLEYNSINPKAATVLANAISFNETLLKLNINGNVLGKIGAQALVAAIQRSSRENRALQVSFINCDCVMDEGNIFSAGNPHGTWRLNLREPYGQMVAAECMYLANYKAGCRIVRMSVNQVPVILERSYIVTSEEGEAGVLKKFKLEEFYKNSRIAANELLAENMPEASKALNNILVQFDFKMEEDMRMQVLLKLQELWTAKAKREGRDDLQEVFLYEMFFALFVINDVDMSGTMELEEFLATLEALGKPGFDPDAAKRLMDEHDKDESGSIDANEFGQIMLNEFCQTDLPRGDLVDASTGQPWIIPTTGHCVIQLSYQCDVPTFFDIGEDHGIDNIIQSIRDAKTDEQREILFQNTTSSPYFFLSFDQAQLLFEEMQGLNRLPLELMCSILPQIVNEEQTNKFIDTNLNDRGKFALRIKLGQLYNSYVGLHTGHYMIDMKVPDQRNGGRRLGAICVTEGKFAQQAGANSSQKGNRSNFRNEKLGFTPVDVTGRWFASVNTTQTLHCDYVSTMKPRKGTPPMTDQRLDRIIETLQLRDIRVVWDRLMRVKMEYNRVLEEESETGDDDSSLGDMNKDASFHSWTGEGEADLVASRKISLVPNIQPVQRASTISHLAEEPLLATTSTKLVKSKVTDFMSLLPEKNPNIRESRAKAKAGPPPLFTQLCPGFFIDLVDFPELEPEAPLTVNAMRDIYQEYMDTCHDFYDIYPEERMRDVSRPNYNATERPPTPEAMKLPNSPPKGYFSPIFPLAYRRIIELQIMMPTLYMTVAQLSKLLEYFPPEEGYLRIQLIQSVFSHVVDLENMYQIYDNILTGSERLELFHRIGIMNLMDPMKPDRLYTLDLRRYDHREWCKILVSLAVAEPGENWEQVEYRWGKYDEPVPGWSLPGTWTWADDGGHNGGPRNHGWLRVYYRSVGNGCFPIISLRKYLRKRTLAGMKVIL